MSYTYVLFSCNQFKEHSTASPIYTFKEDEDIKVVDYIKGHLNSFFGGTRKVKEHRFSEFFKSTIDNDNIVQTINSNNELYAMVLQIPNL